MPLVSSPRKRQTRLSLLLQAHHAIILLSHGPVSNELERRTWRRFSWQLDDKVVERLKKRAKEHGRSLQSEVKSILEEAVPDYEGAWKRIAKLKNTLNRAGRTFSDSTPLIREERDR